ncbi:MAG: RluA family pseudouridine synthase [Rhodospirillales bacterium]|nr:RluA family pseudouridine synthase [Rhodospirillales bacterium]
MTGLVAVRVAADEDGVRLDRWFKRHHPELPFGRLAKLLRTGQIRVDGKRAKAGQRLEEGQEIRVPPLGDAPAPVKRKPETPKRIDEKDAEALRKCVLYRDRDVLIINKPPGLAVQGGSKTAVHLDGMLDALRFDAKERPRLVHRLDKDTSGVIVLARNARAAAFLTESFRTRTVRKLYWAAVVGVPKPAMGIIDMPLAKLPGKSGDKVVADEDFGKVARTAYRIIDSAGRKAAWLAMEPLTGRTHQLRVHCAILGTPIIGDGKYGGAEAFALGDGVTSMVHLHARAIRFKGSDGKTIVAVAPLPDHMVSTWAFLGFDTGRADVKDPFPDFDAV